MALNDKQIRFCEEYIIDFNGAQAAIRAGYSDRTAKEQASRLLTDVNIQHKIKELQLKLQEKTGITAERVIAELAKIAFSDPRSFFDENGNVLPIKDLDASSAAAMASFEVQVDKAKAGEESFEQSAVIKFKMWDKVKGLEQLGKHLGIFEKDNKQKQADPVQIYLPDNSREATEGDLVVE